MNLKALVTGGAGFIGSNLADSLVDHGYDVTVVDNLTSGYESNINKLKVNFVYGDIRDYSLLNYHAKDVDVIFHLAASVGNKRSIDDPVTDSEINVIGSINVLEAARVNSVRKIVASSSAGIYGELKVLPITEEHPLDPDTPYGASKLCMESMMFAYSKLYSIEVACLRYFNVYGKRQRFDAYGNVIPIFVHKLLRNENVDVFGDGEQTRDFVNVNDVVQANIKSSKSLGYSSAFNVASGNNISINELVKKLQEIHKSNSLVVYKNKRPGDVLHSTASISHAEQSFGYSPTMDIDSGLREYVHWALEDNLL